MPNAKIAQCPTPWSLEPNARRNFVDANGKYIGCCSVDDASALVVEAVNEYARRENWRKKYIDRRVDDAARIEGLYADISDLETERERLRDLVWRLSRHLANYITSESENDLLREARAAIGEGVR